MSGKKKKKNRKIVREPSELFATTVSGANGTKSVSVTEPSLESFWQQPVGFSPWFVYSIIQSMAGGFTVDVLGTTNRWYARVLKGYGLCQAKYYDFPGSIIPSYETITKFVRENRPSVIALGDAYKRRTKYYERIDGPEDVIAVLNSYKQNVALGIPQVAFTIFEGIFDTKKDGLVDMPKRREKKIGNHTVAVKGYDHQKRQFYFLNSWGDDWGDNGSGYITYNYLNNYFVEGWLGLGLMLDLLQLELNTLISVKTIKLTNDKNCEISVYKSAIGKKNINVFDIYEHKRLIAWLHFRESSVEGKLEIEDLFCLPTYEQDLKHLLSLLINFSIEHGHNHIFYNMHVQDLVTKEKRKTMKSVFIQSGFNISCPLDPVYIGHYWTLTRNL